MLKRVLLALLCLLVMGAVLALQLQQRWQQPLAIEEAGYPLTVTAGETLSAIALRLERDGVYPHPWLIRLYGRWSGLDQQVKRGEYLVPAGTTPVALLRLLQEGKVISYQVTLPEGITLARAIEILGQQPILEQVLDGVEDPRLAALTAGYPGTRVCSFLTVITTSAAPRTGTSCNAPIRQCRACFKRSGPGAPRTFPMSTLTTH